jgi:hypothetical protein
VSRMITYAYLGLLATAGSTGAQDVGRYPPGQKPFHPPKSPQPAGVLAETCFGYFPTRWAPWGVACVEGPCGPGCAPAAGPVIIFEAGPGKAPSKVEPSTPLPPPTPKR